MLNEQIIEEAKSYSTFIGSQGKSSFGELYDAFIAGAHSRNEEIESLQKQIERLSQREQMLFDREVELIAENNQLRNPWISIKEKMPPIKTRVLFLDNNGKAWLGKNTISGYAELESDQPEILPPPTVPTCKPKITHWMPIPEIPTKQ